MVNNMFCENFLSTIYDYCFADKTGKLNEYEADEALTLVDGHSRNVASRFGMIFKIISLMVTLN